MNPKSTKILMIIAAALFLFILLFERRMPDTLTSLREAARILPGFDPGNIVQFEIRGLSEIPKLTLRREKPGAAWFIIRPEKYPASEYAVGNFVMSLAALPKLSNVAEKSEDGVYGLEKAPIEIHLEDDGGQEWNLKIGAATAAGNGVYLKVTDVPDIYVTDGTLLSRFPEQVNEWKRRIVFPAESEGFDSVKVNHGELTYELTRDPGGQWKLTKPIETRTSQALAVALEQTIRELRVQKFVETSESGSFQEYGLEDPEGVLTLKRGGIELASLLLGDLMEDVSADNSNIAPNNDPNSLDKALAQSRYAKLGNQKDVFLIPEILPKQVLVSALRYRDPFVVNLQPGEVNRLEVRGSEFFVIEQKKDSTNWVYQARPDFPIDNELVTKTLATLSAMRVSKFHDLPNDLKPFGLAPPWRQFVLKNTGDLVNSSADTGATNEVVIAQLNFGFNDLQEAFVKRADESSVYQVSPTVLFQLPRGPFQLRDRDLWDFDSATVQTVVISSRDQSRTLQRNEQGQWGLAPGSSGVINPFAVDEALFKISQAEALNWTDQGIDKLQSYQLEEGAFTIKWKTGKGAQAVERQLRFGAISPTTQNPFAATLLDNKWTIFEFSGEVYGELLYAFGNLLQTP